ncbi:MAG TPA: MazG nucleotide pyrophosphohydrolase domain-containing protein [Nevskia sp.]|nr:MazG nucleotide pyrophosphohydrolase domain-containing protein [Nevskia sp.]
MTKAEPLAEALRLQLEAAAEGFDWTDPAGLWDKLAEEIGELQQAHGPADRAEELGDLLFMVVNLSRHLGVDARAALAAANAKFSRRYAYILERLDTLPPRGDPSRLDRMEQLWQEAKRLERYKKMG